MKKSKKSLVLALGESTHTHIMHSEADIEHEMLDEQSMRFLLAETGVVTHEEHDRIVLNPGKYYKTNQVEFDPFEQQVRYVFD